MLEPDFFFQGALYLSFGVIGLALGSFATAIIYRSQNNISYVTNNKTAARSKCPACHHALGVKDLVPVFSWLFQGGKCRYCKKKIAPFYPLIELTSALLCLGAIHFFSLKMAFLLLPFIPFFISFFYRLFFDKIFEIKLFFTLLLIVVLDIIIFFFL